MLLPDVDFFSLVSSFEGRYGNLKPMPVPLGLWTSPRLRLIVANDPHSSDGISAAMKTLVGSPKNLFKKLGES